MNIQNTEAHGQEKYGVKIREIRALRKHNFYAYRPVLRALVDIGAYVDRGSDAFPEFTERILEWLPGLEQHGCSAGRPGGFVERLRRGTYLPHIAEHVCLELQGLMGFRVGFGRARNAGEHCLYQVLVEYEEEQPAREAFRSALLLTLAAMHADAFDIRAEIDRLLELADDYKLGPSTAAIVSEARSRRIPIIRLTPTGSLVQLGYGQHQKRIRASQTPLTSAIAVEICQEKPLTNCLLRAVGVPVPNGEVARSADEAAAAALGIGFPVVVKPYAGNQGKGVGVDLSSEAEVRAAYFVAAQYDDTVLVESCISGNDYRLLVVNGKMVAAARRDPAHVIGDGKSTVEELVLTENKNPRRRPGHSSELTQILLNEASELALAQQGLTVGSIPAGGRKVKLRTNANLSTGGTATDVTDDCHRSNALIATTAAQILNLDVAGIDIVCADISRPLSEQSGAIVEVNAAPGLRMHVSPSEGRPRRVGRAIVNMLYPQGAQSSVPIVSVTGTNGKTTVTRLIAHMFASTHKTVGMTCTDGIYIGSERMKSGDCSGPRSAEAVLLHPHVAVAVLETARGGILREGLGYDAVDVGVVTNVSADHLGLEGIETVEELARVKQVVVEAIKHDGVAVLNADDRLVAAMAAATEAQVIYFTLAENSPVVASHLNDGGRCVRIDNGVIVLQTGHTMTELIDLEGIPFTSGGKILFQIANALAAAAAAWGAGLNPAIIAHALTTFRTDTAQAPGRFNVVQIDGVEVILDYAHNQAAMAALAQAVSTLSPRHTVTVMGLPGDRRNNDLLGTASAVGAVSSEFILHDLANRRGRDRFEVPRLLMGRLEPHSNCEIAESTHEAIRRGWQRVKPGDRLLIIIDEVDDALRSVRSLSAGADEEALCMPAIGSGPQRTPQPKGADVYAYRQW
ncbi:MAG: cyanophycin synthetase [Candidatus Binatia bacterium]